MSQYVNVAAVQFATRAERGHADAPQIVLNEVKERLESLRGYGLDLVLFAEGVGAVGMPKDKAEDPKVPGPFLNAYSAFAAAENCHVAGSAMTIDAGKVYNSIVFFGPDGAYLGAYHKVNLTIGEIEDGVSSGTKAVVVDTAIGRLGGVICFDLNFEELRREYKALKPDILCFGSMYHGGLMQGIWAYDCQSYFMCAWQYLQSGILDPYGRPLAQSDCYTQAPIARLNLDRAMIHLDYNQEKFPEIRKKYLGEVEIDIPPNIGSGLLFSLTDKRSAMDVVQEFELELVDDYFDRARRANRNNRIRSEKSKTRSDDRVKGER